MVNIPKIFKNGETDASTVFLPLLPLRDIVVFPHMVAPLFVGRTKSVNALSDAMNKDKNVLLSTQKKAGIDNPTEEDISRVGTIGKVLHPEESRHRQSHRGRYKPGGNYRKGAAAAQASGRYGQSACGGQIPGADR
jgi:hypothetical protein